MDKSLISNEYSLNFVNNLAELINTYPALPVITLANCQYAEAYDPDITYTGGTLGNSFVSRIAKFSFYGKESYVLEINKILIEEHLYNNVPNKFINHSNYLIIILNQDFLNLNGKKLFLFIYMLVLRITLVLHNIFADCCK